jgi:uncharacterized membrane protein
MFGDDHETELLVLGSLDVMSADSVTVAGERSCRSGVHQVVRISMSVGGACVDAHKVDAVKNATANAAWTLNCLLIVFSIVWPQTIASRMCECVPNV